MCLSLNLTAKIHLEITLNINKLATLSQQRCLFYFIAPSAILREFLFNRITDQFKEGNEILKTILQIKQYILQSLECSRTLLWGQNITYCLCV